MLFTRNLFRAVELKRNCKFSHEISTPQKKKIPLWGKLNFGENRLNHHHHDHDEVSSSPSTTQQQQTTINLNNNKDDDAPLEANNMRYLLPLSLIWFVYLNSLPPTPKRTTTIFFATSEWKHISCFSLCSNAVRIMFEEKIHLRKTSDHPRLDLDQPKTRERPRNRTLTTQYISRV